MRPNLPEQPDRAQPHPATPDLPVSRLYRPEWSQGRPLLLLGAANPTGQHDNLHHPERGMLACTYH